MVSKPHGGNLVNRVITGRRLNMLKEEVTEIPSINIGYDLVTDLENIAHGVYSLLEGFLNQEDYINVLHEIRLSNDIP